MQANHHYKNMLKKTLHQKFILRTLVVAICSSYVSGCAIDPKTGQPSLKETFASDDPCSQNARNIGIGVGILAGAILGTQVDNSSTGLLLGAALGGAIGGLIGNDMDKRRCELSKIAKQYNLDVQVTALSPDGQAIAPQDKNAATKPAVAGSSVEIRDPNADGGHFESNSDKLTLRAQQYFAAIADTYNPQKTAAGIQNPKTKAQYLAQVAQRKILLIGHTDDTGSSKLNADLSERRAQAVAKIFRSAGINESNIYFQGAGETIPIADNRSDEGRQRNRRVEIIDVTDQASFNSFLAARTIRSDFYRVTPKQQNNSPVIESGIKKTETIVSKNNKPETTTGKSLPSLSVIPSDSNKKNQKRSDDLSNPINKELSKKTLLNTEGKEIDFGGIPVGTKTAALDIGPLKTSRSMVSFITSAHADDHPIAITCTDDHPRIANGVKSLKDAKLFETSDFMPGLYDTSWSEKVNNHLVALTHVAVLKDDGSPTRKPQLLIYKDYKGGDAKPSFSGNPEVNTYKGEKAILYRVFANGPIQCMDIVIPNKSPVEAKGSWLYYTVNNSLKMAAFNPRIAK